MKITRAFVVVGASAVLLAGCGVQQSATKTTDAAATSADAGASAAPAESSPAEDSAKVAKVGGSEGFTYPDGTRVVVSSVKPKKFGEYAAGISKGQLGFLVTVVITNGSKDPIDMALTTVHLTAGANGAQASDVFDENVKPFEGKIAPGRKATGTYGFAVDKVDAKGPITVEVAPGFLDYESALFDGKL